MQHKMQTWNFLYLSFRKKKKKKKSVADRDLAQLFTAQGAPKCQGLFRASAQGARIPYKKLGTHHTENDWKKKETSFLHGLPS